MVFKNTRSCNLCGSAGTNRSTCPYNKLCRNPDYGAHIPIQYGSGNGSENVPYETKVFVYPVDTYQDIKNLPDWVFDEISMPIAWVYRRNSSKLADLINEWEFRLFGEKRTTTDAVRELFKQPTNILQSIYRDLAEEQLGYLFRSRTMETKADTLKRFNVFEGEPDKITDSACNVWILVATINDVPYGAIFAFYNPLQPNDLMIQGISKFLVPNMYAILYPDTKFPRLNDLLVPEIEQLAKHVGVSRIIVDPIGKQGQILERFFGFHPIEPQELPCSIIRRGFENNWLAKNIQ
jgi:hypothetical protein